MTMLVCCSPMRYVPFGVGQRAEPIEIGMEFSTTPLRSMVIVFVASSAMAMTLSPMVKLVELSSWP
ncbi:hypothetical protein CFREN_03385 [Corynebacterium freneyi]|nr:hypothetical protein CFREN_03385 [Corynebacterium freneyi]